MEKWMDRARSHPIGILLVATIAALAASPAVAQSQKQTDACANKDNAFTPDVRIGACSALIESGGNSVAKYYARRCWAYNDKGDHDHAMQDCNEAIRLDPKSARAFDDRGIAYQGKGDLDRAIADYTEAIRLDPKDADTYDNRGNAYKAKGDLDRAVADYTEAIRLDPKDAVAYNNRGNTSKAKGDLDRAIADYDQAIRLDPKDAEVYNNRGTAYQAKGDLDRAIADYDQAIRLDPKYAFAYFGRGRTNLYAGALPKALADLTQANALDPKEAYVALWLEIVNKRSQLPSRLPQQIAQIDMTKWPAPVIRLFLGQMTPEGALAAVGDVNPNTKKGQVCEENFYSGELAVQQGAKDEATRLFRLAVANCPKTFIEFDAANAELRARGITP
jgi:lipoprotein NlpI